MQNGRMHRLLNYCLNLTRGSINRQIFGAALTVGVLTVFIKLVTIGKELVTAWKFGTGDDLDAFLIALVIPSFIINVVAGSFNAALIPTYIRVREQQGIKASQRLFSGATVWSIGLLAIITILMVSTAPLYLPRIASRFDPQKLELTIRLLYLLAPIVLFSGITTTWGAVLNAGERFVIPALSPIITPVISVILLISFESWGIFALAAGLLIGTVTEIFILGVTLHKQGISLLPKWYGFNTHLRQVARQFAPMIAGSLLICTASPIDQIMASMLSPGSVAALNYGNKVIASPISLISTALSTAIIPYFSKMVASQDWTEIRHTFKYYLRLILLTTVPLTGLLIFFSEPIIKILFQRGLFTAEDTHLVSQIQVFSALQIPFYIANILVVRLLTSMRKNYILMWVSGCNVLINIILNYLFIQWMGIKGIALSTSCVYLFSFLFVLVFANKHLNCQEELQKQCE